MSAAREKGQKENLENITYQDGIEMQKPKEV